ncbi:hypothetical protein LTR85_008464 [Meristemomyces frigidus]|nr:hypothetical protein LTR85_008464 [Meristemomyces frigidus]
MFGDVLRVSQPITSDTVLENHLDALKSGRRLASARIEETEILDLLKHQLQLEWSISTLKRTLGDTLSAEARKAIEAAEDTTTTFRSAFVHMLGSDPFKTAPSDGSHRKAQEVFEVPELAEMILCEMTAKQLLTSVVKVNRALSSTITTSPKLQRLLGLRPDYTCQWRSNFEGGGGHGYRLGSEDAFPGVWCHVSSDHRYTSDPNQPLDKAKVTAYCSVPSRSGLRVAPRGRAMLVCQPPVYEMTVEPSCCKGALDQPNSEIPRPPPFTVVTSQTGLTVGDLMDAADTANIKHRNCPYASHYTLDRTTGLVQADIFFTGFVDLKTGDPALPRYQDPRDYQDSYYGDEPGDHEPDPIYLYGKARHQALIDGEAIPTYAEFQAANGLGGGVEDHGRSDDDSHGECEDGSGSRGAGLGASRD